MSLTNRSNWASFAEMKEILAHLPGVRRRVLTSATAAVDIPAFTGITAPVRLSFLKDVKESKGLALRVVKSPVKDKLETLYKLLGELKGGSALIFCNYRETVERVSNYLTEMGVDNEYFHGGMEQPERERALSHFRNGSATVFISTDLASRGLDIPEVKNVIHYHLPVSEEAYVHRNGRTARMNAEGVAYLILNAEETIPEYITREPDEFFLPEVAKKARPFRVGDTDDQSGETGQIEQEGCGRLPLSERWTGKGRFRHSRDKGKVALSQLSSGLNYPVCWGVFGMKR